MTKQTAIQTVEGGTIAHESGPMLPADPMVSMIERIALDPNADLDKLERMLAMKERLDADRRQQEFSAALSACQAEIPTVLKNKNNEQTRSKYADLASIYQAAKPVVAAHGLSFSTFPAPCEREGFQGIRWTLRHEGGHIEEGVAEVPIDDKGMKGTVNKTATHAFGSTASYGRRYLFCMIFDIATGDDTDGNVPRSIEPITADQFIILRDLIEGTNTDEVKFHLAYGHRNPETADLHEFPARFFEKAKYQLECKKAKMGGGND
ncbi:ERF family protein [Tateyamaria sp.]|uniref:ERF family protein n=1 Tax=Tateyamaria sp. TaxID=1929288 RepID=UPI003B218B69